MLSCVMITREKYIDMLRGFVAEHGAEYGISRMGIFGSVARGENDEESDLDVLVEAPVLGLIALVNIKSALEKLFHTNVDVVRKTEYMPPRFRAKVESEVIYV